MTPWPIVVMVLCAAIWAACEWSIMWLQGYYQELVDGCCSSCSGTGSSGDIETNGRCWDCYGTGHTHSLDRKRDRLIRFLLP